MADRDHPARRVPHRKVLGTVADIIEAALAERSDQRVGLAGTAQIDHPVGGENAREPPPICRQRFDVAALGGRCEIDRASGVLSRANPIDHFGPEREGLGMTIHRIGQPGLEHGLATSQPDQRLPGLERMMGNEAERRFVQQVGADQRAIDIDDQRQVTSLRFRRCGLPNRHCGGLRSVSRAAEASTGAKVKRL